MAFIGLIPLYRDSGLMRLDFLVARTKGPVYEVLYFANKLFSLLLGVVMVVAFAAQYPYVRHPHLFHLPYPGALYGGSISPCAWLEPIWRWSLCGRWRSTWQKRPGAAGRRYKGGTRIW